MEFVFVVPRRELFRECTPHGFTPFAGVGAGFDRTRFERAVTEHGFFVERARAEVEPDWKQVIPYTLVTRPGAGGPDVLLLTRSARGGDSRLHHKLSIGIGGHVNPIDAERGRGPDALLAGSERELHEELHLEGATAPVQVGLINDDSNPVGAVHVGLVQVLALPRASDARVREEDVLEGRWVPLQELEALHASGANLETWSALLLPRLATLLAAAHDTLASTASPLPHSPQPHSPQPHGARLAGAAPAGPDA